HRTPHWVRSGRRVLSSPPGAYAAFSSPSAVQVRHVDAHGRTGYADRWLAGDHQQPGRRARLS
ncbi:hypothetical protein, partial [Amycolatopsis solani]|uniref:hypothetical protein n=1 Tax=Amycolatopsis solani TaxID=3028615 RepID=UPI0025B15334